MSLKLTNMTVSANNYQLFNQLMTFKILVRHNLFYSLKHEFFSFIVQSPIKARKTSDLV